MKKYIDLSKSNVKSLPFFDEKDAKNYFSISKGWTFSFVYHFIELKNVFIALKRIPFAGIDDFFRNVVDSNIPFVKTPWDTRRLLEQLNALINFGLISKKYEVEELFFKENDYTDIITSDDLALFNKIYHSYFRFKEIHSWLLSPNQENHEIFLNEVSEIDLKYNSVPIFSFAIDGRFNNAFIYSLSDHTDLYMIPVVGGKKNGGLLRFWDVYVKWGQELGVIEKFNLKNLDYEIANYPKSMSCLYYIRDEEPNIDLLDFIKSEFHTRSIFIPLLVLKIALKYRYKIETIKSMIINQALKNSDLFSLQRTSEIFIRDTERNFIPIYKDSYISHLYLQ